MSAHHTTERPDRRTGIENWDGRPLSWRIDARGHEHYCPPGDHHWGHTERCVLPETAACPVQHPPDPPRVLTRERGA